MRLVNYRCEKCDKEYEEYFNDSEDKPEMLEDLKCECGGTYSKWDIKQNDQVDTGAFA